MTDIHDAAVKRAIRVLVDHCVIRAEDIHYRAMNHIADPDTIAEMQSDVEEIRGAVDFLRGSGMVAPRDTSVADAFLKSIGKSANVG